MTSSPRPLIVACFGDAHEARVLAGMLQHLDFEPEVVVETDRLGRHAERTITPVILYVDPERSVRGRTLSALGRSKIRPCLTVVPDSVSGWAPDMLRFSSDFVGWPRSEQELKVRLDRALTGWSVPETTEDEPRVQKPLAPLSLIGGSEAFKSTARLIARVARCDAPVLIEGETGVGKELAARAVHYLGSRRDHPFVPVNCGALPDNLVENELFGHVRGAYTDARDVGKGMVAQAERGTLFLDEVEALSVRAQVVLLRFLQDRQYRPLGSQASSLADVRIVAASNSNLQALASRGLFREDLLYRLRVVVIRLPPLRDRKPDVRPLAEEFIRQACARYRLPPKALHPSALDWMECYDWPGNVRELEHFIHQACVTADGPMIYPTTAETASHCGDSAPPSFSQAKANTIVEFERRYLERLMRDCDGNVTRAAKCAGKERRALGKLLKRHALDRREFVQKA